MVRVGQLEVLFSGNHRTSSHDGEVTHIAAWHKSKLAGVDCRLRMGLSWVLGEWVSNASSLSEGFFAWPKIRRMDSDNQKQVVRLSFLPSFKAVHALVQVW
jgi:hypothetical protein